MDNNKMTRAAKNLDILANVGGKLTAVAGIVCIVVACLTLVFGGRMFAETAITLDLDFVKFHLSDHADVNGQALKLYVVAAALGGSILCFLVYYISRLLRKILSPMKLGRPFEAGIAEHLKKVGWAVLIGWFLSEAVGIVARFLLIDAYSVDTLFLTEAITKTEFVFTVDFDFAMVACVIFFLSYIFTYGQTLQQESDETL